MHLISTNSGGKSTWVRVIIEWVTNTFFLIQQWWPRHVSSTHWHTRMDKFSQFKYSRKLESMVCQWSNCRVGFKVCKSLNNPPPPTFFFNLLIRSLNYVLSHTNLQVHKEVDWWYFHFELRDSKGKKYPSLNWTLNNVYK